MATCAEAMARSAGAFTAAGLAPVLPPAHVKREVVVRSSLGPIGRLGFPIPTRANASTLRLFGPGLCAFADWQVGPALRCEGSGSHRVAACRASMDRGSPCVEGWHILPV